LCDSGKTCGVGDARGQKLCSKRTR
jgi:hypothetical protein